MHKKEEPVAQTALYRKYRPRSLDELVGQAQVTEVLKRGLAQGKIAHAYLLTGPKGTGKTSIARILAHEINKLPYGGEETHLDIIEIDAASNNGVDDVRDLRDKVQLAPIAAAKKVYIIDEVHMLSKPAFNALLKTLEEPPAHIVFILATTDLHKVPATIISRTQHFAFHAINTTDIAKQLKSIAGSEKIKISDDALNAIAARGDGSFRNSIGLLDQMSSFADDKEGVTLDLVETTLGLAPSEAVNDLLRAVAGRDVAGVIGKLDELETQGIQPTVLADQLITALRRQLAEQPQCVTLLDALLSVSSSGQPQLKLITVLVGAIKPKTAAVHVAKSPTAVVEVPIPQVTVPETPKSAVAKKPGKKMDLDWNQLIEYTKKNQVALYSVLGKCEYEYDNTTLTLYAGRKFNKTKLDEPKYQAHLAEALEKLGIDGVEIVILASTRPPADKQAAKVAVIMGGGQEVDLNEG
jgi:DNA polymerase III subunit gamma/tau